jgi:hypothetical protein
MGRQIMGAPIPPPPPVLDCARVLEYGVVNNSVEFSGRTLLFVNRIELGRVPCLAICESKRLPGVLLFHCDAEWNVLSCVACATVKEAKERAERTYPGLSAFWVDAKVSEDMAERYLDQVFGHSRCSLCGKRADQIDRFEERGESLICNFCIQRPTGST